MPTLWTIGHSNRSLEEFLALLRSASIQRLVDVRRFPMSRRHPQFDRDELKTSLEQAGIHYRHVEPFGGRRNERLPASPNTAWRVEAFNAFADHMQSEEFQAALTELMASAENQKTVIMCAEALPWQCHRRLIADALVARGWEVLDLMSAGKPRPHALTEFAVVREGTVTYPGSTLF
jgi:uncharacterized protein (DUF488 family)